MKCPKCKDGIIKMNVTGEGAVFDLELKNLISYSDVTLKSHSVKDISWFCDGYECEVCGESWGDKEELEKDLKTTLSFRLKELIVSANRSYAEIHRIVALLENRNDPPLAEGAEKKGE